MRVYVCVCVRERERDREIEQERDCARKRACQITFFITLFQGFVLLVCVSKREGERDREREHAQERKRARERLHTQKKELNHCACYFAQGFRAPCVCVRVCA